MFEADITKVVEEMAVRIRETEEEFILDTIFPYCQETLQRKINKAELKQIILRGSRPKGKWIKEKDCLLVYRCSNCKKFVYSRESESDEKFEDLLRLDSYKYCPRCGADMRGENNGNMD